MIELPTIDGGWGCVLADSPWRFQSNSVERPGRNAMRHYDCMSLEEIAAMPVRSIVADDAFLFLWITGPFLAIGAHLPIFKAWGFKASTMAFVWDKQSFGTGYTTRQSCEFIVAGRRGRPRRESASVRQFLSEKKREHSRKPDEIHKRIESICEGPRLELFGRRHRLGWAVWGNDVSRFDHDTLDADGLPDAV
jgi:N6-adenosine-specific RNA methylase IME4